MYNSQLLNKPASTGSFCTPFIFVGTPPRSRSRSLTAHVHIYIHIYKNVCLSIRTMYVCVLRSFVLIFCTDILSTYVCCVYIYVF